MNVDSALFCLVLIDLPADATVPAVGLARPLGERAALIARIVELLPGTTFSKDGHGSFKRGSYHVEFSIEEHAPHCVEVQIDHRDGFVPLKRLVAKTGWQTIDPVGPSFVDVEATAAAGAIVPWIVPPSGTAGSADGKRSDSRRWIGVAAVLALVLGAIWSGWTRNQRTIQALARTSIGATESGASAPADRDASRDDFIRSAEPSTVQMARMKLIAPDFRADPIVNQLYDYRQAAAVFPSSVGGGGFMSPERLSDAAFFAAIHTRPYLPPVFAQPERDGYRFDFVGQNCTSSNPYLSFLANLCNSFVYVARPFRGTHSKRSYALLSSDFRVHYRNDGGMPTLQDPTVDNTVPATAADMPKAEARPQPQHSTGLLASLRDAAMGMIDTALGRKQAEVQLHESNAVQDLRALSAAENAFHSSIGEGRYAAPEQLADEETFARLSIQPLLDASFVQPRRQGYEFEFVGQNGVTPVGRLAPLGRLYESFIYVAKPSQPGPEGRRTFVLYPNGRVFVTRERRVPTSSDEPLGLR